MYFGQEENSNTFIDKIEERIERLNGSSYNNRMTTVNKCRQAYYSNIIYDEDQQTSISENDDGLLNVKCNQARSLIKNLTSIITKNRLSFEPVASNSDVSTISTTKIAKAVCSQVKDHLKLDALGRRVIENMFVDGGSFIQVEWDDSLGTPVALSEDNSIKNQGDVKLNVISLDDITYDYNISSWEDLEWVVVSKKKNKWELIKQFPKLKDLESILSSRLIEHGEMTNRYDDLKDEDCVYVREFFHKPSPLLPEGRMVVWVGDIVIIDMENPYKCIPVVPFMEDKVNNSLNGYPLFYDLIGMQEVLDSELSVVVNNHASYGVQSVLVPNGSDIDIMSISGLNFIKYNPQVGLTGGGKPEPLNLTQTPAEIFNMLNIAKTNLLELSGINSAMRGAPPAGVTSGVAIATLSANSIEFASSYIATYTEGWESIMMLVLKCYNMFASTPRIVLIAGKNNKWLSEEFKASDFDTIKAVKIKTRNSLSDTVAGRIEMANALLQSGMIKSPTEFLQIQATGEIDQLLDESLTEFDLINSENEEMREGKEVQALSIDDHSVHVLNHKNILNSPMYRRNEAVTKIVLNHIMEHITLAKDLDPAIAEMLKLAVPAQQQAQQMQMPQPEQGQPVAQPAQPLQGGI